MLKQLFLGVLSVGSLIAYNHPCPDQWQLSGEFLYMLPTVDDTYYLIQSPSSTTYPNGTKLNNDFSFQPGFRVGAEYSMCSPQREFQVYYTYLGAEQNSTTSGSNLWATLGRSDFAQNFENYTGGATANLNLLYQRLDFTYAQQILNSVGLYLYLEPAIEFAYLRFNEGYTYHITGGTHGSLQERSKVEGVGPQLGFEFGYDFYNFTPAAPAKSAKQNSSSDYMSAVTHTLSLAGIFSGSLLASWSKAAAVNTLAGEPILNVTESSTWRVIPALHARAGVNYDVRFSNWAAALGIGYEFNSYIRGVTRVFFPDNTADGLNSNLYYNFDVQGLYLSGAISF
jgi:hypothetical protein